MADNTKTRSDRRGGGVARQRHSIGAQLSVAEYERLQQQCVMRGCTPSELVRSALRLEEMPPLRPLLVAAGHLIRVANAHHAAVRGGDWYAAATQIDDFDRFARELIRLAAVEMRS